MTGKQATARPADRPRRMRASFVCSTAEHETISAAAARAGMGLSGYVRALVLHHADIQPFLSQPDRAILGVLVDDLRDTAITLNRIGRALAERELEEVAELRAALHEMHAIVVALAREFKQIRERRPSAGEAG